jgi:chemosensory pili system protein ChpA (sensor histidine kinase/response regulator)
MSNDFDRDQLVGIFVTEAADDMARLWAALHPADKSYPDPQDLQDQYAVGHKLKGAALLYGFTGLGKLGQMIETVFEEAMVIDSSKWPGAVDLIREIVTSFRSQLDVISGGGTDDDQPAIEFQRRIDTCVRPPDAQVGESHASAGDSQGHDLSPEYLIPQIDAEVLSYFAPEAEEYLNTIQNLLQRLESNLRDQELIHQLYRVSHTLKGSAYTVGFQVVGDIAHPIEACMIAVRENRAVVTLVSFGTYPPGVCRHGRLSIDR